MDDSGGDDSSLDGTRILITGANTGIGESTAKALAGRGATVVLACRSRERTQPVLDEINAGPGTAELVLVDLADLGSVRDCARQVIDDGRPVHVLINNAGVAGPRGQTAQGFELAFGINHLGHFLLTNLLLDHLRQSSTGTAARVVNLSSDAHFNARGIDWEAVTRPTRSITGMGEYSTSKLANVLFTQELARRVSVEDLTTYAVHPGVIASDIWRRVPWPVRPIMTRFMRSTEEGSATTVHCATSPEEAGRSGQYYEDCAPKEPNEVAQPPLAAELWARSEEWCGLA